MTVPRRSKDEHRAAGHGASSAGGGLEQLEEQRRALYRPGAEESDTRRYLEAVALSLPGSFPGDSIPARSRGRSVLVAALAGLLLAGGGVVAAGLWRQDSLSSMQEHAFADDPATAARQRAGVAALFSNPYPKALSTYFEDFPAARPRALAVSSSAFRGTGSQSFSLPDGPRSEAEVAVALACTGNGPITITVEARVGAALVARRRHLAHCGDVASGEFLLPAQAADRHVRVGAAATTQFVMEVSQTPSGDSTRHGGGAG